jgi:hypothetical protein
MKKISLQIKLPIAVACILILACGLITPSKTQPSQNNQENPLSPESTESVIPDMPPSAQNLSDESLKFLPNNFQSNPPENGWVNYYFELAAKNSGASSVQIDYLQLNTYGLVTTLPTFVINNGNDQLSFTKTTIELIDTESITSMPNESQSFSQEQTLQINLSEQVVADIPGSLSSRFLVEFGRNDLVLELSIPITNKDITQDQEFSINAFLIDEYGYQYSNVSCPDGFVDKLGPGQSEILKKCFTLPVSSAALPRHFILSYYWNEQEITYSVKIDDLENCEALTLDSILADEEKDLKQGGYEGSRQVISVPEEKKVSTNYDNNGFYDIWTINAQPNKDIIVKLIPDDSSTNLLFLAGPDGNGFPSTDLSVYGNDEETFSFFSYCNGPYYFIAFVSMNASYTIVTAYE